MFAKALPLVYNNCMKIDSPAPFEDYFCYKVFHKKMKRWQVCLVNKHDKLKRRTILYSKFIMSVHVGRILKREEEVDHKDEDKTNDDLKNLEIVTREENTRRWNKTCRKTMVTLYCPHCEKEFIRQKKNTHLVIKTKKRTFCSASCSGKFNVKKRKFRPVSPT